MKGKLKITYNSPVILTFVAVSGLALILSLITGGNSNKLLFSVYRSSWLNPLTYIRLFTHVLGHAGWEHYSGNMVLILLAGPLLEEKYGSKIMLEIILITAFITGLIHIIFFPHSMLLGASGIVFAFILLASSAGAREGEIPITLIIAAVIYIGGQIYSGIAVNDDVSNITHIAGGIVGGIIGMILAKPKNNSY